eukprot:Polyplicarium_translucidae@DN3210_c0_g1_i7.p2
MNMVKKLVGAHKNRWDVYLADAVEAYRRTVHRYDTLRCMDGTHLPLEGAGPRRKGPREAASRLRARCPRQARRPDVVFVRNLLAKRGTIVRHVDDVRTAQEILATEKGEMWRGPEAAAQQHAAHPHATGAG